MVVVLASVGASAAAPVVVSAGPQSTNRVTYALPNALPDASCKTNGGIGTSHTCWGEIGIPFSVKGLTSNEDVVVTMSAHYSETFGCANTVTGAVDPARKRVLIGWGGGADNGLFPFATNDDGTAMLSAGISLHSPNPNGNTAPDGYTVINASFNCAAGAVPVRTKVVLDHVVGRLQVQDRAPGNVQKFALAIPGVFTSSSADYPP